MLPCGSRQAHLDDEGDIDALFRARQRPCQRQDLWRPGHPARPVRAPARRRPGPLVRTCRLPPVLGSHAPCRHHRDRAPARPLRQQAAHQAPEHRIREQGARGDGRPADARAHAAADGQPRPQGLPPAHRRLVPAAPARRPGRPDRRAGAPERRPDARGRRRRPGIRLRRRRGPVVSAARDHAHPRPAREGRGAPAADHTAT
jgi:hypothetical protein